MFKKNSINRGVGDQDDAAAAEHEHESLASLERK